MNSCLYDCRVMHHRLEPIENRFVYSIFLFCIDLDELDSLHSRLRLFSRNRPNFYSFFDRDHFQESSKPIRDKVEDYLRANGVNPAGMRILMLTHARTLGYVFNPVCFYFCFRPDGDPECAIVEVSNTFREIKPYFVGREDLKDARFLRRVAKHFYVSPFIDLEAVFDFRLNIPGELLDVRIDDWQDGKRFFLSSLTGKRRPLRDSTLVWYSLRFPLVTLKVIAAIHWQAFKLYLRKLPFHRKSANPALQKGLYRGTSHS